MEENICVKMDSQAAFFITKDRIVDKEASLAVKNTLISVAMFYRVLARSWIVNVYSIIRPLYLQILYIPRSFTISVTMSSIFFNPAKDYRSEKIKLWTT